MAADGSAEGRRRPGLGGTVAVRSPAVAAPAAVRYGWHELAIGNLENGAGLPASPFRTDK